MSGRLFAVVGPSGVGKDTLLSGVCAATGGPIWARRVITRPESASTEPFEGVTDTEFARRLEAGDFALHWQAHGLSYGVPKSELAPLAAGQDVVFNGSRAALPAIQAAFPEVRVISITAPVELRAERLAQRGRETQAQVAQRLARETAPLPAELDVIEICNDTTPDAAIAQLWDALYPNRTR